MNTAPAGILDTVRIIDTREVGHEWYETVAMGHASYKEHEHELVVDLDGLVRRFEMRGGDAQLHPAWLPKHDTVRAHVAPEEAVEAAKEIFDVWSQRVRRALPHGSDWKPDAAWLKNALAS